MPVEIKCRVCGKRYLIKPYLKKMSTKGKYCSLKCYYSTQKHPVEIICQACGKKKTVPYDKIRIGKGKYCSKGCYNKVPVSKKTRKKQSVAKKKNPTNYWLGKKRPPTSEETKRKLSESLKKNCVVYCGEASPCWRGGISREPYSFDFTKELKELIRKRDNYKCQECQRRQEEHFRQLSVHHIDYNKKNSDPKNLITLCTCCHGKTNYARKYWIAYFNAKKGRGWNYLRRVKRKE